MQQVFDATWEKAESPLQRGDRRHRKELEKRRVRQKRIAWYIILAMLGLSCFLYICFFMK